MDPGLNSLLKWSVENSTTSASSTTPSDPSAATRGLSQEALSSLFGGPSDADLMKLSMSAILSSDPEITLSDKLVAFDNFEQLIENLDNANNLTPLGLWEPLLGCLENEEEDLRKMAAWCVGTAVQNNERCQEKLVEFGGIEKLVGMLMGEKGRKEGEGTKRKVVYAVSSGVRNYQVAMDVLAKELKLNGRGELVEGEKIDAGDMEAVDGVIGVLREEARKGKSEEVIKREEEAKGKIVREKREVPTGAVLKIEDKKATNGESNGDVTKVD